MRRASCLFLGTSTVWLHSDTQEVFFSENQTFRAVNSRQCFSFLLLRGSPQTTQDILLKTHVFTFLKHKFQISIYQWSHDAQMMQHWYKTLFKPTGLIFSKNSSVVVNVRCFITNLSTGVSYLCYY